MGLQIIRVDFPHEVGFSLAWKNLEGLLSHASLLNKREAGIPVVCQDEKGRHRNRWSCRGMCNEVIGVR